MRLLSIGEAADQLGVAVGTLRRWHWQERLAPFGRTVGGQRARHPRSGFDRNSYHGTRGKLSLRSGRKT
jgi:predicted site-specific integrase-resolvase